MDLWGSLFGKIITTFAISMVPILELRGAIPIGVAHGLNIWTAIVVSILGNLVPVPFIIIFIKKIFAWLRTKSRWLNDLVTRMEKRAEKKSEAVQKYAFWGLFILVAIPLPGTGAWMRMLGAASESARSSARLTILETLTRVRPARFSMKSGSTPNVRRFFFVRSSHQVKAMRL